ncbi:hypothetical protein QBC35DRAFT_168862 [Podospora australis]|uniref:Zn(2)-C6 fungal-type domain-containing protein n=1 Tax=Podospora australis TaxID=1536484 RepID=A0AAN7ADF5_9PEZI|nr:hypothetical protein QBC35DRAFT_168862 [Podospora australis]
MSSTYPPPPTAVSAAVTDNTTAGSTTSAEEPTPPTDETSSSSSHPLKSETSPSSLSQQPQSQITQGSIHPGFAADAVAAAHHGLQALQAAVAGPQSSMSVAAPAAHQALQHQHQHQHHQPSQTLPAPVAPTAQYAPPPPSQHLPVQSPSAPSQYRTGLPQNTENAPKATRLRRACDMCSQRKVKCDETQPCRPCRDLGVECTFNRAMKRRGPPNKHAEAAKAAKHPRLEPNLSPGPHIAAETLISIAGIQEQQTAILDAESIAPMQILIPLVDDFFTYIHPLAPFPHEPTFRQSFMNREDRTNREFLALLASMIGCLVASFPRSARQHLKLHPEGLMMFPKATNLVERCRDVALEARGKAFLLKEDVTVYDAATSYFLGLAAAYTMQFKVSRRFMSQTMDFVREMGYHKPKDVGSHMFGVTYRGPPFNHVEDQLGKRIFWCMFVGVRSMVQLGGPQGEIIFPPPTPTEPYPDFPAEVDDQYILPHQILCQPDGLVSLLTGFNQGIKIYLTMNGLASVDLSYGITSLPFHDQKSMLDECLRAVEGILDVLPRELTLDLDTTGANGGQLSTLNDFTPGPQGPVFDPNGHGFVYMPAGYPPMHPGNHMVHVDPERRRLQYEIQKANIYASQLATRSYYVERYLDLRDVHRSNARHTAVQAAQAYASENGVGGGNGDAVSKSIAAAALHATAEQNDPIDDHMSAERELIVQHLLKVITTISQRNIEPNGGSIINKIRQVASTLVNCAPERKGPIAMKAGEPLSKFVDILVRLERAAPVITHQGMNNNAAAVLDHHQGGMGHLPPIEDEEQELRNWADLREHQVRFLQAGGYMSLI